MMEQTLELLSYLYWEFTNLKLVKHSKTLTSLYKVFIITHPLQYEQKLEYSEIYSIHIILSADYVYRPYIGFKF